MNYSRQRELIFNSVKSSCSHPTAEMIHQSLKKEYPTLSLATVYRNLNQLSDLGIIKRLHIPSFPDRYDGRCEPHYHLACRCCNQIIDVAPIADDLDVMKKDFSIMPHKIEGCDILLYGVCEDCLKK